MDLTLRKTVIGGETNDSDFTVLSDGVSVGRINEQPGVPMGRPNWSWGIVLPDQVQPSDWRGLAASLEEAKAAFKKKLEEIGPSGRGS